MRSSRTKEDSLSLIQRKLFSHKAIISPVGSLALAKAVLQWVKSLQAQDGLCKIQCLGFALNNIGGGAGRASKGVNRGEKTSHESIIFEVGQWFTRVHGKFMILFCFYIYLNF